MRNHGAATAARLAIQSLALVALILARGPDAAAADLERGRAVAMGAVETPIGASACFVCHGLDGAGDASGAFPRLSGQAAWYLYKQLKDYASGARPNDIMSPIARLLTDQEMEEVAVYYAAQRAPAARTTDPDPRSLQAGGAISARGLPGKEVAACVNCHGAAGRGLPPSFPYLAGQYAPYTELQMMLWKRGERRNDPLGVMRHIAQQLSPEEIRALAAYFEAVGNPDADPANAAEAR